ncbi:peptide chain release factor 2 [Patescibacteria group bacterium]
MKKQGGFFDFAKKEKQIKELEKETEAPDFWKNQNRAKEISQKLEWLREEIEKWNQYQKELKELNEIAKLIEKEHDQALYNELRDRIKKFNQDFSAEEFKLLFQGEYDQSNAILAVHAGTGGVDAQDWAEMLLRMYLKYMERKGFKVKILEENKGQEAGIKRAVVLAKGPYAYGYLKTEAGVHRLVRKSPFNAKNLRQTSFALVEVLPEIEESKEVEIKPDDLKIDVFRASGHGGQSVNTTDSAVRATHLPTGIVVTCQNERSQLQNKEMALKILRSKLHLLEQEKQEAAKRKIRGEYSSAEWGNQIRSYVLDPYKLVKDHRTNHEVKNVDKVLDGELDSFIETSLENN